MCPANTQGGNAKPPTGADRRKGADAGQTETVASICFLQDCYKNQTRLIYAHPAIKELESADSSKTGIIHRFHKEENPAEW